MVTKTEKGGIKMDTDTMDAIKTIIRNGFEFEAIRILQKEIEQQLEKSGKELADCKAKLKAIKKINNGKNEGISYILED